MASALDRINGTASKNTLTEEQKKKMTSLTRIANYETKQIKQAKQVATPIKTVTKPKNVSLLERIGDTIGGGATSIGKGFLSTVEGAVDFGRNRVADVSGFLGAKDFANTLREQSAQDTTSTILDPAKKAYSNSAIKEGGIADTILQGVGQVGAIVGSSKFIPEINVGKVLPKVAKMGRVGKILNNFNISPSLVVSSAGRGEQQALKSGATNGQAVAYGIGSGTLEGIVESLSGGIGGVFGKGAIDDVVTNNITKNVKNKIVKNLTTIGIKSGFEGLEENISGVLDPLLQKMTYNKNAEGYFTNKDGKFTLSKAGQDFLAGSLTSALLQSPSITNSVKTNTPQIMPIQAPTQTNVQNGTNTLPVQQTSPQTTQTANNEAITPISQNNSNDTYGLNTKNDIINKLVSKSARNENVDNYNFTVADIPDGTNYVGKVKDIITDKKLLSLIDENTKNVDIVFVRDNKFSKFDKGRLSTGEEKTKVFPDGKTGKAINIDSDSKFDGKPLIIMNADAYQNGTGLFEDLVHEIQHAQRSLKGRPIYTEESYNDSVVEKSADNFAKFIIDNKEKNLLNQKNTIAEDMNPIKDIPLNPTKESSYDIEPTTAQVRKEKISEYRDLAKTMTENIATWKDKKRGLNYQVNTMERNFNDIIKNPEEAKAVIDTYIKPITESNAQKERFINDYNNKISELKLTDKESTAVQMMGEYKYNPETNLTGLQVDKYLSENNIDINKINNAVEVFRNTYDDLIVKANAVLKEQGYKEIPYRQGYFPHFIEDRPNSIIGKMAEKLGWKFNNMELPTDIAGMTDIFNPGKTWFRNAQQRTGKATDFNALKGYDNYIRGVADIIFHTENIQKISALENEIRYQYSDKGVQEEIDKINNDSSLSLEEKEERTDTIYRRLNNQMPNLVTELRNYKDSIANKKSIGDRNMEQKIGREAYNTMTNIHSRLSANMVGLNVSSALTNFIPLTQAYSQISTKNMIGAIQETVKSYLKDDGFANQSTFLTNRTKQADRLYKTGLEKASDKAGLLFTAIDNLTSNIIVRGKYAENISKGMSEQKALENADSFAKSVMAGRDKGSMPTIFNQKNPIVKLVTTFQLEQANQFGYMFKDLPKDMKDEGAVKITMAFLKMFLGAWLYNKFKEEATGTKSAFSPIDIIEDTTKTLTNSNLSTSEKVIKAGTDVIKETPFAGGLLGGGRLPIDAAIPNLGTTVKSISDLASGEGNKQTAINNLVKEFSKPVFYLVPPFGGGQAKKTVEGLSMYNKDVAGSYTPSGGLRFPVKEDLGSKIKAGIFGQYSSKEARNYFDNNYSPLGEKQIKEYKELNIPIIEYRKYLTDLSKSNTVENKVDLISKMPYSNEQKNIMVNNAVDRKEKIDISNYDDYENYNEFDFATKNPEKYQSLKDMNVSYEDYKQNKKQYDFAISNPSAYKAINAITDYNKYIEYKNEIDNIKTQYNNSNERKNAVIKYVNSQNLSIPQKAMIIKKQYSSFDTYNKQIVEYVNSKNYTKQEKTEILTELGFKILNGKITW